MSKFFHGTYRVGLCWSSLCLSPFFHFLPWVFIFSNLKLFAVFVSSLFYLFLFLSEMMNSPHPQSSATIAWLNLLTVKDLRGYLWPFLFLGFCRKQAEWIAKCEDMTKKVLVLKNCQLFCCVCVFILDSVCGSILWSQGLKCFCGIEHAVADWCSENFMTSWCILAGITVDMPELNMCLLFRGKWRTFQFF